RAVGESPTGSRTSPCASAIPSVRSAVAGDRVPVPALQAGPLAPRHPPAGARPTPSILRAVVQAHPIAEPGRGEQVPIAPIAGPTHESSADNGRPVLRGLGRSSE